MSVSTYVIIYISICIVIDVDGTVVDDNQTHQYCCCKNRKEGHSVEPRNKV